ncbi:MAG: enoyl-CoA hydratase [Micromonosporaceae bacterium]|nr:enoyl-CoA hydratase [Micromonosporaceae bacterium]
MTDAQPTGDELVTIERHDRTALITLNRPRVHNAQNGALLYALDRGFQQFAEDDSLAVAVLRGAGRSFSSGHDLGPGADRDVSFDRRSLWWDHVGKEGVENRLAREEELYVGLCRRWRALPKPTIAMVHGACIGGGLMLAWSCDLIVAASDAFFSDPVVAIGIPGVEYFAHPWVMSPRRAKEMLFTGRRIDAEEALRFGMVNHVYPAEEVLERTLALAGRVSGMPRLGLALAKSAVNRAEDAMGLTVGMDSAFGLHQLGHAHNAEVFGDPNHGGGQAQLKRVTTQGPDAGA